MRHQMDTKGEVDIIMMVEVAVLYCLRSMRLTENMMCIPNLVILVVVVRGLLLDKTKPFIPRIIIKHLFAWSE